MRQLGLLRSAPDGWVDFLEVERNDKERSALELYFLEEEGIDFLGGKKNPRRNDVIYDPSHEVAY